MKNKLKYLFVLPFIAYVIKCMVYGVRREKVLLSKVEHDLLKMIHK